MYEPEKQRHKEAESSFCVATIPFIKIFGLLGKQLACQTESHCYWFQLQQLQSVSYGIIGILYSRSDLRSFTAAL